MAPVAALDMTPRTFIFGGKAGVQPKPVELEEITLAQVNFNV